MVLYEPHLPRLFPHTALANVDQRPDTLRHGRAQQSAAHCKYVHRCKKALYDQNIGSLGNLPVWPAISGYDYRDRKIDLASCGLTALADKPRAQRIEAEHIFPAAMFGNFRACWRSPGDFPECAKSSGRTLSGRECCQRVDSVFESAHNDLFNLVPSVGEINGKRSNYNWGMISGEQRAFGTCNIEVDSSTRRVEPPENVMGDIARTMLYMSDTYVGYLSLEFLQPYTAQPYPPPGVSKAPRCIPQDQAIARS